MKKLKIVSVLFVSAFLLVGSFLAVLPKEVMAVDLTVENGGAYNVGMTTFKATGYIGEEYLENFPANTIVEKGFKYWNTSNNVEHTASSEVFWNSNPPDSLHSGFYHNFTGMMCENTYQYRAYAKNQNGFIAVAQNTQTVTLNNCNSGANNPFVTTGVVSQDQTNANFLGSVQITSGVTEVGFEYGLNISYGQTKLTNLNSNGFFGAMATNLTCGNTYHYRAYAKKAVTKWAGIDKQFTVVCFEVRPTPAIWGPSTNTGGDINPHFVMIPIGTVPKINNTPINPGDWIGAFYENDNGVLKYAGGTYWKGTGGTIFSIMGDYPIGAPKNGFAYDDPIHYKIFSNTTMKEYDVSFEDIVWDTSDPVFVSGSNWAPLSLSSATVFDASTATDFDAYAVANPSSVCKGQTVTLTGKVEQPPFLGYAPGDSPYEFSWFKGNTLMGDDDNFVTEIISNVEDGFSKYFLKAEDHDSLVSEKHPVIFNVLTPPTVSVSSNNNNVCVGQYSVDLNGSVVGDYNSLSWTSSDPLGSFSSNSTKNPQYYLGNTTAGQKTLTLTANNICSPASESLIINVLPKATVNAGSSTTQCATTGTVLNLNAVATEYATGTFIWTKVGSNPGVFADALSPITTYTPSASDISNGSVTLKACAKSNSPCDQTPICSTVVYTLTAGPTVSVPPTKLICENQSATITATTTNNSSVSWITSGDGTFNVTNIPVVNYTPGTNDKLNGTVTTTVSATSNSCSSSASKQTVITIKKLPVVNAGLDITSQGGTTPIVLNGSALNSNGVVWSKIGSAGNFSNPNIVTTTYYPSAQDVANGYVTLTLKAFAVLPCSIASTDTMTISFGTNTNVKPTVETTPPASITQTGVTLKGNITTTGSSTPTIKGFEFGLTTNYGGNTYIGPGSYNVGVFTKNLSGLTCNTTYHYRAYATSSAGTGYGSNQSFTTSTCGSTVVAPTITTAPASAIGQTSVTLNGVVSNTGGTSSVSRWFKYSTAGGSEITTTPSTGSTGQYLINLTGLICGTSYSFQAYASNSNTANGISRSFTTLSCNTQTVAPTVTTVSSSSIDQTSVTLAGNVINTGGENLLQRGFEYFVSPGGEKKYAISSGTSTGSYQSIVTNLVCDTTYIYVAFAKNSIGSSYGSNQSFTTSSCGTTVVAPTVTTTSASKTQTQVVLIGKMISTGGQNVIERGFDYGKTTDYGTRTNNSGLFSVVPQVFGRSFPINSLACETTYNYRAYAYNGAEYGYGDNKTFVTNACPLVYGLNTMMANALTGFKGAKSLLATDITPIDNEVETPVYQNQNKEQKVKAQGLYRMLKMEMSGNDILELQRFLNTHGYVIATTGPGSQGNETRKFGKLMREAVMKFQTANGLKADGIVGPKMIAKVKALQ